MSEALIELVEALERDVLSIAYQRGRCVGSRGHDRAAVVLEGRQLKKVFGPLYGVVMRKLGIGTLRTWADMNRFVEHLLDAGL